MTEILECNLHQRRDFYFTLKGREPGHTGGKNSLVSLAYVCWALCQLQGKSHRGRCLQCHWASLGHGRKRSHSVSSTQLTEVVVVGGFIPLEGCCVVTTATSHYANALLGFPLQGTEQASRNASNDLTGQRKVMIVK